jgi:hypothetical protein
VTSITAHLESDPSFTDTKEITVINDAFSLTNPYFKRIPRELPAIPTLGVNVYGRRVSEWEQAPGRGPQVVFDGLTGADYDGQANSWAAMKADHRYTPAYVRWFPRGSRESWMIGAWFQGSIVEPTEVQVPILHASNTDPRSWIFDQSDWTTVHVIRASGIGWNGAYTRGLGAFDYFGVFAGSTASCQVNEVEFYYYYCDLALRELYERVKDTSPVGRDPARWAIFAAALEAARVELNRPIASASQKATDEAREALERALFEDIMTIDRIRITAVP